VLGGAVVLFCGGAGTAVWLADGFDWVGSGGGVALPGSLTSQAASKAEAMSIQAIRRRSSFISDVSLCHSVDPRSA
jgi:hypothetical protein